MFRDKIVQVLLLIAVVGSVITSSIFLFSAICLLQLHFGRGLLCGIRTLRPWASELRSASLGGDTHRGGRDDDVHWRGYREVLQGVSR